MEYGTNIHETLEYANFKDTNNIYVSNLLKQIDNNYIKIYREYEFNYQLLDNNSPFNLSLYYLLLLNSIFQEI